MLLGLAACEKELDNAVLPPPPPTLASAGVTVEAAQHKPGAPYNYVEQIPQYKGGQEQILADSSKTLKYPAGALAAKIEGQAVAVYFTIPITFSVQ